jgi:hypothetical protein
MLHPLKRRIEIARLENSIAHLARSNDELNSFANGQEVDEDDKRVFEESAEENRVTMSASVSRSPSIRTCVDGGQCGPERNNKSGSP